MARKLRVGVIGTGFGSQVQLPAFRAHPRVEIVALASGQPGKAAAVAGRFGVPLAFDDYTALVKADLDLVSITTPPDLHHPMTMAALARGRHVICEKPMALSAVQAGEMLQEAERRGVIHLIDHELRFNPTRRRIKSLIDEGFIGHPRHALFYSASGRADSTRPWTWWSDAARGGGILGAFGSHTVRPASCCNVPRRAAGAARDRCDPGILTGRMAPGTPARPIVSIRLPCQIRADGDRQTTPELDRMDEAGSLRK